VLDACGAATVTGPACIGNAIGPVDVLVEDGGPTANRRWALSRNLAPYPPGRQGPDGSASHNVLGELRPQIASRRTLHRSTQAPNGRNCRVPLGLVDLYGRRGVAKVASSGVGPSTTACSTSATGASSTRTSGPARVPTRS